MRRRVIWAPAWVAAAAAAGHRPSLRGGARGLEEDASCALDCVVGFCVARDSLGVCAYDVSWRESPSFQGDPVTQLNVYVGDAVSFAGDQDLVELPSAPSLEHCDFSPSAELASRADVQQGFAHTFDEAGSYYLASARGCDRGATLKVVVAPRKPGCHRHDGHDCHCHDEEKPIPCGSGGDAAFARELADVDARCGDYLASCSSGCAAAYRKAHQHLLECPDRAPRGEYAAVDAAGACHDPGRAPAYSDECALPYEIAVKDGNADKAAYQAAVDGVNLLILVAMLSFVCVVYELGMARYWIKRGDIKAADAEDPEHDADLAFGIIPPRGLRAAVSEFVFGPPPRDERLPTHDAPRKAGGYTSRADGREPKRAAAANRDLGAGVEMASLGAATRAASRRRPSAISPDKRSLVSAARRPSAAVKRNLISTVHVEVDGARLGLSFLPDGRVDSVMPGGETEAKGMRPGDRVVLVGSTSVTDKESVIGAIKAHTKRPMHLSVQRPFDPQALDYVEVEFDGPKLGISFGPDGRVDSPGRPVRLTVCRPCDPAEGIEYLCVDMTGEKLGLAFTPDGAIKGVQPGSEAAQKGIKAGDRLRGRHRRARRARRASSTP
ncbi:hypothetical protein SO694_00023424 [Aureococcus anophagefferens]|uniref:PDZ domain-containing protein n=1 Tax=Aureococcus anophagefferens TaxID=44056 RepID=A0ABR1FTP1_AURAN